MHMERQVQLSCTDMSFASQNEIGQDNSAREGFGGIAVVIPVWVPGAGFRTLVEALAACGFGIVLVVDDGSGAAFDVVFAEVAAEMKVEVVRHALNRGKGAAIKTALGELVRRFPQIEGAVTVDADGQHLVQDVLRVAEALRTSGGRVVLGCREFGAGVPLRCRVGNGVTRWIFERVVGVRLRDTQSGLRGIPRARWRDLKALAGERYEYELMMLVHECRAGRVPVEVPIRTVYLEGNGSSHFRPVRDSARVLWGLLLRGISS
jgi:glycosyltransferase involved in cell wall biosynthesis